MKTFKKFTMMMSWVLALGAISQVQALASGSQSTAAASAKTVASYSLNLASGTSQVEFLAIGRPSAIKIRGKSSSLEGILKVIPRNDQMEIQGSVRLPLTSLDTGIEMRNRHMKEKYFEVGKFPNAELTITDARLPFAFAAGDFKSKIPFQGILDLHGQKKPVNGMAEVERNGNDCKVKVEFSLQISHYGIPVPEFSGVTVAEEVQVTVTFATPMNAI
jgi:polyisoprenoid-binding protein YceI